MAVEFNAFVENNYASDAVGVARPLTPARIAVYDDMLMPPRVVMVEPSDIRTYLAEITKTVYDLVIQHCDEWSFQVIRELVENFIHASFTEPTISILDRGKTIVFCDQGPGIPDKQAAVRPSFSSATDGMKHYIRGVGSGFPIVNEWLRLHRGSLTIEDNLGHGTTVTASLITQPEEAPASISYSTVVSGAHENAQPAAISQVSASAASAAPSIPQPTPPADEYPVSVPGGSEAASADILPSSRVVYVALTSDQKEILALFAQDEKIGPKELSDHLGIAPATGSRKLRELALTGYIVKKTQKYVLTREGERVLDFLLGREVS